MSLEAINHPTTAISKIVGACVCLYFLMAGKKHVFVSTQCALVGCSHDWFWPLASGRLLWLVPGSFRQEPFPCIVSQAVHLAGCLPPLGSAVSPVRAGTWQPASRPRRAHSCSLLSLLGVQEQSKDTTLQCTRAHPNPVSFTDSNGRFIQI